MAGTGTSPASSALLSQSLQQPFLSGVVEGFYGTPWSLSATKAVLGVMQQAGMNAFVYAPKADP
ncbi:MAG: beta-N-acetylglucosaminidase domain-containing protein, partial [Actinomycetota bacterium]|nr:beta-N-acetylglucosaminidase domain-containing protein [Actinomycetota bacterium]